MSRKFQAVLLGIQPGSIHQSICRTFYNLIQKRFPIMYDAGLQETNPPYAIFLGSFGAACAIIFPALGASYGTAMSGMGIAQMAMAKPELLMKSLIPVVMAGIIAIYGLVVSVLIAGSINEDYSIHDSYVHLGAGLSVGLPGLAAGFAIGIAGDAGVRGTGQQPRLFVGMILILIFAEVLGLYGLIVAIYLYTKM